MPGWRPFCPGSVETSALALVALAFFGNLAHTRPADAAVVVLDNQTTGNVDFTIRQPDGRESRHTLAAGDLTPIPAAGPLGIAFDDQSQPRRYRLRANNIYCFVTRDQQLDLSAVAMPGAPPRPSGYVAPPSSPAPRSDGPCTISVKLLADDQEPRVRAIWEKQLRERLAAASAVFERHCRVRFQAVAVETWGSERQTQDFNNSVAEFEREVRPEPARLAIGFTSRYKWVPGENHVGGIRGPLRPHILIREALVKVSEPERLEVLVHELGHFLGAVHAPDGPSVMRPAFGDHRACARDFCIGFDAHNTLAMYLVGEELAQRPMAGLWQLPPESKAALRRVYASLAKTLPDDPAAPKYLMLLDQR